MIKESKVQAQTSNLSSTQREDALYAAQLASFSDRSDADSRRLPGQYQPRGNRGRGRGNFDGNNYQQYNQFRSPMPNQRYPRNRGAPRFTSFTPPQQGDIQDDGRN